MGLKRKANMVLILMLSLLIPTICLAGPPSKGDPTYAEIRRMQRTLDAIRKTETGGHKDPKNAKGLSGELGPFQIKQSYFKDSGIKGRYVQVKDVKFAEKVVVAYMKRYASRKRLGRTATPSDIARIHNGGPNGYKDRRTLRYRTKFLKNYNKR